MSLPAIRDDNAPSLAARLTETAYQPPTALDYETWENDGYALGVMGRGSSWWIGDWVNFGEQRYGEKYSQALSATKLKYKTLRNLSWVAGRIEMSRRRDNLEWAQHSEVAALSPDEQDRWLELAEASEWTQLELRKQIRGRSQPTPVVPAGQYQCITIDPPWPMDKIVRDVRPKQGAALDYPTMSLEQIEAVVGDVVKAQNNCHVYLWVTQRFLPAGLDLFKAWDVEYQCAMTWVKNVGPTPFSWMYDTEHVLFGRRGSLPLEQMGLRLSFQAPTQGHSVKPSVFYERVALASPGPRLAMFERQERDGFEVWGAEAPLAA